MANERQIFERLFLGKGPMRPLDFTHDIMLFGLFNYYKWDQAVLWEKQHNRPIPPDGLGQIELSDERIREIEQRVSRELEAHADHARPAQALIASVAVHGCETTRMHQAAWGRPSWSSRTWAGVR